MAFDPRIRNLARVLVRYCVSASRGQCVGISGGTESESLIVAVYEELLRCGAFPVIRMTPDAVMDSFYTLAREYHLKTLSPYERAFSRVVDSTINILSSGNTKSLSGTVPRKQMRMARLMKPVWNTLRKKPWVLTLYPTRAYAQDAEMSLREFEDFVFAAAFADRRDPIGAWRRLGKRQERLIAGLRGAGNIRIEAPDTDLNLSVKGRKFVNSDGHNNMPSGEIFAAPLESSAEGHITFDLPSCRYGREIAGVRLTFRKGAVVNASAEKNEKFLKTMLKTDRGAQRLGEIGIGTNYSINKCTRNILFDEKTGGTVHLALGKSPSGTGGRNSSAIHWDLIKDLRKGGSIKVDGRKFQRDGKFIRG
ncbi:MAG: aminopeptidase [Kiritimatiellia bacterium]